jgi:uncharacterized repeat protein (TIGR02543 family)
LRDVTLPEDLELGGSSIPTNGLVAYFPFTNGTCVDETGNGHINLGRSEMLPAPDRFGVSNCAYEFTGQRTSAPVVEGPEEVYSDNFTYSVWAKTNVVVSEEGAALGYVWHAGNAVIYPPCLDGAGCGLAIGTNGVWLTEHSGCYLPKTLQYSANIGTDWNHYAVTVENNGAAKLYVNGQHVATASQSNRRKAIMPGLLGCDREECQIWGMFTGVADDYAFYNRALSPEEVAALYSGSGVINLQSIFSGCTSLQTITGCGFTVVTFDAGEGTLALEETTKIFRRGAAFGSLPAPTRDGFKFMGWQTAQGEVVDQNTIVSDTNDGTLTATWVEMQRYDNLDEYTHSATPWTEQSSTTYDGVSAFQSGAISHNGTSSISIDVVGSGTLSFRWKVSSEGSWDFLRFYIDNVQQASISGSVGWEEKTYAIPAGTHTIKWAYTKDGSVNSNSDCGWLDCVTYVPDAEPPEVSDELYYVIDLSGGTSATNYPVTTLSAPPAEGWTDEYKTTKLVLRRIEAGSFQMGGSYNVTISQPFYMGVFEVTQKQYELVTGSTPSEYAGDARPVEFVPWNTIRGNSDTYNWPSVTTVDPNSFMGKIRAKTGLTLDLPTEAQWEYACRAGTTSNYNNGGSTEADLQLLGRYNGNQNDGRGGYTTHTTVGSYTPNAWGLYDMHGNVWEWCLDYWSGSLSSSTDPKGPMSGSSRVLRGGVWYDFADDCTSSSRDYIDPSYSIDGYDGFRLACPVAVVNTPEDAARLFTYSVANGEVTITGLTDEAYAGALVIPETIEGTPVTSIGNGAFSGCDGLTSVIIPEGVLSIENRAFWSCQGLTYVLIPSTVTRIGDWALGGCPNLTSLMIPQGVVSIGDRAFWGARSLTEFVVDAENSHYGTIDGLLCSKDGAELICAPSGLTSVIIPEGINSIGCSAFNGFGGLTSVTIPSSVTEIKWAAFDGCSGLTSIIIPSSVAVIEDRAFAYCSSLTSIVIPDGITTIGEEMFLSCSRLRSVSIPRSVCTIESSAFYGCYSSLSLEFEGMPPSVVSVGFGFPSANGTYRAEYASEWEAVIDANGQWNNLTMTCVETPEENDPLYYVIDLSGGASATSYPVTTLSAPPARGWTDEYKTTKLVLRRIEAGTFLMSESYNVTISQPFYMGVFEVTQKQYELVTGSNPSNYTGDARPVECVTWSAIRGNSNTYNWPSVTTVSATSFMGKLRAKTGLTLDLPTEAQWEYACRAGTTSAYNNGGNSEADLALLGRYSSNMNDGRGGYLQHTKVGSYLPNLWGLYDMHGNVWEWCLDWSGDLSSSTDPKGPTSGSGRVLRGGGLNYNADYCTSSFRRDDNPSRTFNGRGLRLACPAGL